MDNDMRDRLARAEQNIVNTEKNFQSFKADDFGSLKREVHSMRSELNTKIDALHELVSAFKEVMQEKTANINIQMAKWGGGLVVVIFVGRFIIDKFIR